MRKIFAVSRSTQKKMMQTNVIIVLMLLVCAMLAQERLTYSILYDASAAEHDKWQIQDGQQQGSKVAGWAVFEPHTHHDGWAKIHYRTNGSFSDDAQSYAAGYLEGYATFRQIQTYWPTYNQVVLNSNLSKPLNEWLQKNMMFMLEQINKPVHQTPEQKQFWSQANLILTQVHGIYDGYAKHFDEAKEHDPSSKLTFNQIYLLQLDGDVGDLYNTISPPSFENMTSEEVSMYQVTHGHCSVIIRYNDDRSNLFMTHSTWDTYANVCRIQIFFTYYRCFVASSTQKSTCLVLPPRWFPSLLPLVGLPLLMIIV